MCSIVYETTVITSTPTQLSSVTATATVLVEETDIVSVVETDEVDYTATVVESYVATSTGFAVVTIIGAGLGSKKRDEGGKLPDYAAGCSDEIQYISACSCIGVLPLTTTGSASLFTSYIATTVTPYVEVVLTTVETIPVTLTATTVYVTKTFSTQVSQAVDTVIDTVTYSTAIITQTSTTTVAPPDPTTTFGLVANYGAPQQPNSNIFGYTRALNSVAYFIDFTSDGTAATQFALKPDGTIQVPTGPTSQDFPSIAATLDPHHLFLSPPPPLPPARVEV